jgi:hypothetical protein
MLEIYENKRETISITWDDDGLLKAHVTNVNGDTVKRIKGEQNQGLLQRVRDTCELVGQFKFANGAA